MEKTYKPQEFEQKIYEQWEKANAFTPRLHQGFGGQAIIDQSAGQGKPFSILLPLPNANDPLHMGHALFTIQDIMIRYHRMLGDVTLWLPGGDHAGIETQYVFEKKLAKLGKSRFDYDRETLYQMIEEFVGENKNINRDQMKRLGFSLDWTRYHYSLEPKIVDFVFETFRKLHQDGLIYRNLKLVNYCIKCGTAYSDLEINHREQNDPLYYLKYGPFVLATVRPETKFGDTAVAVNPKDKRYQKWIGKEIEVQGLISNFKLKVVGDSAIDPKFGTGVAKVTPAHDHTDFEIANRHNLEMKQVIGFDGRLLPVTHPYAGLKIKAAREKISADLKAKGLISHIDANYVHSVATCYKCQSIIEPLPLAQWYVKTKPLAKPAIQAVKTGLTKIVPLKRFEKLYFDWLTHIQDWNISRQIVWGPRIPAWYCLDCNPQIIISFINKVKEKITDSYQNLKNNYQMSEIKSGLQSLKAPVESSYQLSPGECEKCQSKNLLQETDTFDTWFLSGQWPLTTLGFTPSHLNSKLKVQSSKLTDFDYFYPTSVLDTLWDILFFWVARMMMLGIYRTGKPPFKIVHIHSRVVDKKGQKMSKSKANVINPIDLVDKYGADALRMSLIFGSAPGSDIVVSDDKVRGMRNFTNKIWNIGRFVMLNFEWIKKEIPWYEISMKGLKKEDQQIIEDLNILIQNVTRELEKFHFSQAGEAVYEFLWHNFADKYVETVKTRLKENDVVALSVLRHIYLNCLKLLHPFMPFITETIWQQFKIKFPDKFPSPLILSSWPL